MIMAFYYYLIYFGQMMVTKHTQQMNHQQDVIMITWASLLVMLWEKRQRYMVVGK